MSERPRGYAHRVDIVANATDVWRGLTEAEHLVRWCAPDARLTARKGGLFRASVDRGTELEASIDVFEPGRRLRLIHLPSPGLPAGDSTIVDDFMLAPAADGTVLRLLGSGFPNEAEWNDYHQRLRTGWQQAVHRLKVLVEKQMRRPDA
jgi:uncharacterized protein YndB with AHSA1/START domain